MSTLRVDKIKARTGTTVTIPDSQNLSVTGALTVTGTQSFAAGASLSLQGENVNSGTRGQILYYDSSGQIAKLNIGASGAVIQSDGTDISWGNIGGAPNIYYVSTNGVDAAGRGGSIDAAFKTIKYACGQIGTPTATSPAVIYIKGGVYEEVQLPIIVPPYTSIAGDTLRSTIVKPKSGQTDSGGSTLNVNSTLFRCSNGTILQDMVLDGMTGYVPGNPAHAPESATVKGTYFALNSASPITDKSPYIYNITSFGDGATGAVIDGSLHATGNKSMLFHTYTAIHSDGVGVWAHSNGVGELISVFTYYCQVGIAGSSGADIRVLNSSCSYGEYGVYAGGFDASETTNNGPVVGTMLTYTNVLATDFQPGEQINGGTSSATAYVVNIQSEPKRLYIVQKSGTFQAGEVVTGTTSGATATLDSGGSFESNQTGRVLVTTFTTAPIAGDALTFATTDGNAYQIQSVSQVTGGSVDYNVIVFATSRATAVPATTVVNCRKRFSLVRLTGHDFMMVGTGDKTTTNWPGDPTQAADPADQIVTNTTDPGRVYHVSTDELGNFYVGEYFKVDQATGKVTLDASAFDLKGLESLQLGSVGGLIGAQINEFSTDVTLSQNSNDKVPTQKAVKTYVDTKITGEDLDFTGDGGSGSVDLDSQSLAIVGTTNEVNTSASNQQIQIGLPNDVTIGNDLTVTNTLGVGGNLTVTGNFTVNGTTTTVNTTNTTITDNLLELNSGAGSNANDCGILVERGSTGDNAIIAWDESADQWVFGTTTATNTSTGNLTIAGAPISCGNILGDTITTSRLITNEVIEKCNIDGGGGLTSTVALNLKTTALNYFDTDSAGNWTWNARGDGSTTFNSTLGDNESLTFTNICDHGGTAHYMSGFQIDGSDVYSSIHWAGGSAPEQADAKANGTSVYTFTIIKRSSGNYKILANFSAFED